MLWVRYSLMGSLVVIGNEARVGGFALGGAVVLAADQPDLVVQAWESLPEDTSVVVLTPEAATALSGAPAGAVVPRDDVLCVVMPS
jgi:vacuolar-type H+-ATPase subunit F/Vma7